MRLGLAIKRFWFVLALAVASGRADAQPAPGGPPAVGVVRVATQQITQSNEFVGRIQSIGRVSLVARVTAFLEQRLFVEGAEVKKGDLLYLLEQPPFQAQVDFNKANVAQLQAQHTFAEQQLARAEYLLKTVAGQQQTVDQDVSNERSLAAQIASAQANLQTAQINLGYTEIRALIDGKISATAVTEGNVVSPTSGTLATLVSQDPMYAIFPIAVRTALELRDKYVPKGGFRAVVIRLRLPTGKIYDQVGHLDYVSPTIDQNTDTITLRGVIPNPVVIPKGPGQPIVRELTDQEFVTVLLEGVQPVEVLGIPRAAVLSDQQGDYVYVVDAQNRAQVRRIHLGQSTPTTAVITSGLSDGELVISEGVQRARPGEVVSPGPAIPGPPASGG
ncbi:MAG: efflux RND transporter periplasmic adaptor subunit [Alphaproteobacteria bacterium]|nr:efflux RND transporter periplasmic adaptor subunit [Alphaproteobacteria bacterium]